MDQKLEIDSNSRNLGAKDNYEAFTNGVDDNYIEDFDDDPFARKESDTSGSGDSSDEQDYDDPDKVDLDNGIGEDEEIDSDEAFGEGDEEFFKGKGFTFRGSMRSADVALNTKEESGANFGGFEADDDDNDDDMEELDHIARPTTANKAEIDREEDEYGEDDNDSASDVSTSENSSNDTDTDDTSPEEHESSSLDRVALREMMAEEQKSVVASISEATKADAAKGAAVKQQYNSFDSLVGTRMQLQMGVVAMNTLSSDTQLPSSDTETLAAVLQSAESAALNLLNSIFAIQTSLDEYHDQSNSEDSPQFLKRPFSATLITPTSTISNALSSLSLPSRERHRSTLTKWSNKTAPISSLALRNKLIQTTPQQPLISVLDSHLQEPSLTRLLQRTQTPRSCAPHQQQAASVAKKTTSQPHDPSIFDDADFYALLLRELIEHKKTLTSSAETQSALTSNSTSTTTTGATPITSSAAALEAASSLARTTLKQRKKVEPRASKGRKMRYTVHEKLLNFMAPQEPPASAWSREAAEELFGGLFGRRKRVKAGDGDGDDDGSEMQPEERELAGVRLVAGIKR